MFFHQLIGLRAIMRDAADEGGGGGGGDPPPEGDPAAGEGGGDSPPEGDKGKSFFKAGEKDGSGGEGGERPDWLMPQYKSAEDQAKAYRELYGRFSKKTDDLKAEVETKFQEEWIKGRGVPEEPDGYEYPEGYEAPPENVDAALRTWAKENQVGAEAFQKLIGDVYGLTQANAEAELEKLGKNAEARIERANDWVVANVDKEHYGVVSKVMTTAEGIAFVEAMMKATGQEGIMPDDDAGGGKTLTRESIREMQADPRYQTDEGYQKKVRQAWNDFAAQQRRAG